VGDKQARSEPGRFFKEPCLRVISVFFDVGTICRLHKVPQTASCRDSSGHGPGTRQVLTARLWTIWAHRIIKQSCTRCSDTMKMWESILLCEVDCRSRKSALRAAKFPIQLASFSYQLQRSPRCSLQRAMHASTSSKKTSSSGKRQAPSTTSLSDRGVTSAASMSSTPAATYATLASGRRTGPALENVTARSQVGADLLRCMQPYA